MKYSDDLKPYNGPLKPEVTEAITDIKRYFKVDDLKVFEYGAMHIVVAVDFQVSLPSRGSVDDLIQATEPVLIQLSLYDYPEQAPMVRSDRKDFPKARLSHRYYTAPNKPASLCLVRDNLHEWFASVRLTDLLFVAEQWFYKAAIGKLNEDGDEFDPIMLEKYIGKHIYKYEKLKDVVENDRRLIPEYPMAALMSCQNRTEEVPSESIVYKTITHVPILMIQEIKDIFYKYYGQLNRADEKADPMFGMLVWSPDDDIESTYCTDLPTNYGELKTYFNMRGIAIDAMLKIMDTSGIRFKRGLPIIHAIKRPKKIIGYNGEYEFFNFALLFPEAGIKDLKDDSLVCFQKHIEPFGKELAAALSGEIRSVSSLFVGAGSLGSKMILHDARTGKLDIGVSDHDTMLQHNLVRHELFQDSVGKNKAVAIIEIIQALYALDTTRNFQAFDSRVNFLDDDVLAKYKSLIDTTASLRTLHHLTLRNLPTGMRYCRCEIADDGELGLLYKEGDDRNPRMDDLVKLTNFYATMNPDLERWRRNDARREVTNINIGLGCSSTTTVMPDDLISAHAASFSRILTNDSEQHYSNGKGLIYLNIHQDSKGLPQLSSRSYLVEPFEVITCLNGSGWSLRMISGTTDKLLKLCSVHAPTETGGVLVGVANYKTKVIHIFDIITEPQDSRGTCTGFHRGTKGLPEAINYIKAQTGEVIGYIGEWHTHPMDLKRLSGQDLQTVKSLKAINAQTPIPTCAVIVTPDQILPYVFE